jgi:hypothetical protein
MHSFPELGLFKKKTSHIIHWISWDDGNWKGSCRLLLVVNFLKWSWLWWDIDRRWMNRLHGDSGDFSLWLLSLYMLLIFFSPSSSSMVYSRRREFTPELFSLWIPFLFLRAECYGWSCIICVSRIECDTTVHYLLYLMSCYILRFVYSAPPGLTIILAFFQNLCEDERVPYIPPKRV